MNVFAKATIILSYPHVYRFKPIYYVMIVTVLNYHSSVITIMAKNDKMCIRDSPSTACPHGTAIRGWHTTLSGRRFPAGIRPSGSHCLHRYAFLSSEDKTVEKWRIPAFFSRRFPPYRYRRLRHRIRRQLHPAGRRRELRPFPRRPKPPRAGLSATSCRLV